MSSTTVHSKKQTKTSIVATSMYLTEKSLEVPEDAKKLQETLVDYIGGEGMEIPVGNAIVNEKGEMKLQNGTVAMMSPEAIKAIIENRKQKQIMKEKLAGKEQETR